MCQWSVVKELGSSGQDLGIRDWGPWSHSGRLHVPAAWPGAAAGCRQHTTAGCWARQAGPELSARQTTGAHQFTAKASTELSASSGRNPAPAAGQKGAPGCCIFMQAPADGSARVLSAAGQDSLGMLAWRKLWQMALPGWRTLTLPGHRWHGSKGAELPDGSCRQQHGHAERAHVGQQAQAVQPFTLMKQEPLHAQGLGDQCSC